MSETLVSVITPTYNRAAYIAETVESVLRQTHPRIEHIVVDDGSRDDTPQVLTRYADRVRLVRQPNSGEPVAVNHGFSLARGEIIGVVNDDDPVMPELVAEVVAAFAARPDVLVIYPDWKMIDSAGAEIARIAVAEYDYVDMLRWHHCMPGPGTFFRRRCLEVENGRDPAFRLVGDFEFWMRVGLHGPFWHLPKTLATWRHHGGATSVTDKGPQMAHEHLRILEKLFARPDFPAALRRHQAFAWASAYYMAGLKTCERSPALARRYFLRAFRYCPWYLWRLPPNFAQTRPTVKRALLRAEAWARPVEPPAAAPPAAAP
jgi:glycosyltransferase involved in cell wall biosynthesis